MKGPDVKPGSSLPGSTSTSLIVRLQKQDRDAWVVMVKLYGPLVYGWCRRRGLQTDDAADISQEVFRAVAAHVNSFDGKSFRGWLWTITRNKIMDHHRRGEHRPLAVGGSDMQAKLAELPELLDESASNVSAIGGLVKRALDQARPDFTDNTWQAFTSVVMDGQAPADVAAALGMSVNAVFIAKGRVLRRLRDLLGEDFL